MRLQALLKIDEWIFLVKISLIDEQLLSMWLINLIRRSFNIAKTINIYVQDDLLAQDNMVSSYYLSEMTASFKTGYEDSTISISDVNYDT